MTKDHQMAIRLTSKEWAQLQKLAKGESVAAMVRVWIREKLGGK